MGLIEGMGNDMEQGEGKQGKTALQHHEPHLGDGGPGERGFDGRLGQHDETAKQGREAADHHQKSKRAGRQQKDIGKADQQEPAAIDHTCMQQRGNRCGRFHDFRQPAMHRKLG